MRIITEENVDQLLSMSYSDNINKLLKSDKPLEELIKTTIQDTQRKLDVRVKNQYNIDESPEIPYPVSIDTPVPVTPVTPVESLFDIGDQVNVMNDELGTRFPGIVQSKYFSSRNKENLYEILYGDGSTEHDVSESRLKLIKKHTPDSPPYADYSPAYVPNSPEYNPNSPPYNPNSPPYNPNSPPYAQSSSSSNPPLNPISPPYAQSSSSSNPPQEYPPVSPPMASNSSSSKEIVINPNILDVPEEKKEEEEKSVETDSGEKKVIIQEPNASSSDVTTSSGTKKITL